MAENKLQIQLDFLMVQFKAAYLSLGGRSLAGGSSLPLSPWRTCFNIRHAYPSFTEV